MRRVGITLASVFGAGVVAAVIGVVVLVVVAVNSLSGAARSAEVAAPRARGSDEDRRWHRRAGRADRGLLPGPPGERRRVIQAAKALGIGPHTQAVGVMTAIGESSW